MDRAIKILTAALLALLTCLAGMVAYGLTVPPKKPRQRGES